MTEPAADSGSRMTIREHLEELRSRLLLCLIAVLAGFVVAFWQIEHVMNFMRRPLEDVIASQPHEIELIQTKAFSAFFVAMKLSFFAGCIVAAPIILHQAWAFIAAGLYDAERKTIKYYAIPGLLLFFAGAFIAYQFVMPWAIVFLVSFASDMQIKSWLDFADYLSFVAGAMFIFGAMFQLPVVMVFLMRIGVVRPETFARYRRGAIVGAFALAMVLTPPEVISQIILAGCMIVLYEGAILIGRRVAGARTPPPPDTPEDPA